LFEFLNFLAEMVKLRLKKHPQDLPHKLQLLVEMRKIKEPLFLKAIKLFPPAVPGTLNVNPRQVGMFTTMPDNSTQTAVKIRGNQSKNKMKYTFKTTEIRYDEDELRELFYQQHPMEKRRPITFNATQSVVWDSIFGTPSQELRGENVIQRTLHLMAANESASSAYKQALKEFYKERESEEGKLNTRLCEEFLRKEEEFLKTLE
jgi:hypothetical protein